MLVPWVSLIAVSNDHKFSGHRTNKFTILQFRSSEVYNECLLVKIKVSVRSHFFLAVLRRTSFLALSTFYRIPTFLCLWPSSSILKDGNSRGNCHITSFWLLLLPFFPTFKKCGLTQVTQDTFPNFKVR